MLAMTVMASTLVLPTVSTAAPAIAGTPPAVYPAAGTTTASAETDVSVRGVPARRVEVLGVEVHGDAGDRGPIEWRQRAHRDGRGATIDLDETFAAGDEVVVDLRLAGRRVDHRFTIAEEGAHPGPQLGTDMVGADMARAAGGDAARAAGGGGAAAAAAEPLVSRPDLRPPSVTVTTPAAVDRSELLLATPSRTPDSDQGTMIFDDDGELVWFRPNTDPDLNIGDLKVVELNGRSLLSWFEGTAPFGAGSYRGEYILMDETYREVGRIRAGNGMQADIHDLQITAAGTALLMIYHPVVRDLSSIGGRADALVLDSVVQEVDVATGDVLFEWRSLDHIPVTDAYTSIGGPVVDYAHVNAVEEDTDGDILISLRHTSEIVKVDRDTGDLLWRLGGKHSTFDLGDDDGISYPHDVRATDSGAITIFDNGNDKTPPYSRGVVYDLDLDTGVATVVAEYRDTPEDIFGPTQGAFRLLDDGTASVAWGGLGKITEMTETGAETFEAELGTGSYRIIRADWTGRPTAPPDVAVSGAGDDVLVHASWNGATEVASWELLAGPTPTQLEPVATVPRDGFETTVPVPGAPRLVAVRALDAQDRPLGRSTAVTAGAWYEERSSRTANGSYTPVAGQFVGGPEDDVFWYGPGAARESLWPSTGSGFGDTVETPQVVGAWEVLVGNFFGDDHDEIVFWRPGSTLAHLWRWADGVATSAPIRIPAVDEAILLDHAAGFDEVLWYGRGATPDRIDGWRLRSGQVSTASRASAVAGSYVTASGDFDANGWADVLWYTPGSGADHVWYHDGRTGAPTGHVSRPIRVDGTYQPVVGRLDPSGDAADDILWLGASDHLWAGRTGRTFASTEVFVPAGAPLAVPGDRDHVLVWRAGAEGHVVRAATGAPFVTPTGNTATPAGAVPVVGDFTQAGQASVFWYRPGAGAESLFVSPRG